MKRQEDGSATAMYAFSSVSWIQLTWHHSSADDQQNDVFYTCPVHIGTPAQTLDVVRWTKLILRMEPPD